MREIVAYYPHLKSKRMKTKQAAAAEKKSAQPDTTNVKRRVHRTAMRQPLDVHHASAGPSSRVWFADSMQRLPMGISHDCKIQP
mmetsp:Transcript_29629/g.60807  ORF Transcript_29629/g.60807 Transcript_29629/m.60807 type:complete len:84 (-) Transcript_29629:111-362(-)